MAVKTLKVGVHPPFYIYYELLVVKNCHKYCLPQIFYSYIVIYQCLNGEFTKFSEQCNHIKAGLDK